MPFFTPLLDPKIGTDFPIGRKPKIGTGSSLGKWYGFIITYARSYACPPGKWYSL